MTSRYYPTPALMKRAAFIGAGLFIANVLGARGEDSPHWRGLSRNAITTETSGWDEGAWPLADPLWTCNVGDGATTPIVVGGRLYTLGWKDDIDTVYCLDAATGIIVWKQAYPSPRYGRYHQGNEHLYGGPSPTPEYDGATQYLYTLSNDGALNCWDTRNQGKKVWGINLYDVYGIGRRPSVGGSQEDYGFVTAPLVYGNWVLVEVGDDEGNLMAFDKRSGQRRWVSECKDPAGHTAALVPITVEGVPGVVVLTLNRLVVVRLDRGNEGKTMATYDWQTHFAQNIPTPGVQGEYVVVTTDYNMNKMAKLKISLQGATLIWEQKHVSKVCAPVIHHNNIYLAWRELRCIDFETGLERWSGGKFGEEGSLVVTGDGRLVVCGNQKVALVETADHSPDAYKELSAKVGIASTTCWPHVVMAGGRLFVKDKSGYLCCFSLRKDRGGTRGSQISKRLLFSFATKDCVPELGGAWGLWPREGLARASATFVPGDDAEKGQGGSLRIDYQIDGPPNSVALWIAPPQGELDLTPYDRLVVWAKGEVDAFSLVVEDVTANKPGGDQGVAEYLINGVTKHWQRFSAPLRDFRPRKEGTFLNWSHVKTIAIAIIHPPCPRQGSLQIDNLQATAGW